jgi:hypothetical protein
LLLLVEYKGREGWPVREENSQKALRGTDAGILTMGGGADDTSRFNVKECPQFWFFSSVSPVVRMPGSPG